MNSAPASSTALSAVSIHTARLHIRELEPADWPAVHRYAADPRLLAQGYHDWFAGEIRAGRVGWPQR